MHYDDWAGKTVTARVIMPFAYEAMPRMSKRAGRCGFGRFSDAPTTNGALIGVAELVGFVRETSTHENH